MLSWSGRCYCETAQPSPVLVLVTNETEGERLYENWRAILHLIDILCCCAVLVPIIWQVNSLEKSVEAQNITEEEEEVFVNEFEDDVKSDDDNRATRSRFSPSFSEDQQRAIVKLKLFRSFYLMVVAYIYLTRIVVFLVAGVLGFRYTWVQHFLTEVATLAFYVVTGYKFRPREENPYLELKKGDDNLYWTHDVELEEEEEMFVNAGGVSSRFHNRSALELT